jgi:cell division topological specificity factor
LTSTRRAAFGRRFPPYSRSDEGVTIMSLIDLFKKKSSSDVAKDRLKLLLVSDRANCSPEVMEMIKNDIIKVISKYMVIDAEGLDIQITQTESENNNGSVPALYANIPIRDLKKTQK